MKIFFFLIIVFALVESCYNTKRKTNIEELFDSWKNKEILFPNEKTYTLFNSDTIRLENERKLTILLYIDSIGCTQCKAKLFYWKNFVNEIVDKSQNKVWFDVFICPKNNYDIRKLLISNGFSLPIVVDKNDSINKLNDFPQDDNFHCFLLDENNRVVLIGNPVQNTKIRELYIRTICERLGINPQSLTNTERQECRVSLGTFPWREPQNAVFYVRNAETSEMIVDTLYTSCECTSAVIDKLAIANGDSAKVTVTYRAERPESFVREVYLGLKDGETITLTIEGNGVE